MSNLGGVTIAILDKEVFAGVLSYEVSSDGFYVERVIWRPPTRITELGLPQNEDIPLSHNGVNSWLHLKNGTGSLQMDTSWV